jgi:hypothetical protein
MLKKDRYEEWNGYFIPLTLFIYILHDDDCLRDYQEYQLQEKGTAKFEN